MCLIPSFLPGGNRRRRRRGYKALEEIKQAGCMCLGCVGVGWSGQGLARGGWVEQLLALVGLVAHNSLAVLRSQSRDPP